jgi:hypothetical protein
LFKVAEISSHGEYSYYGSVFIGFEIFLNHCYCTEISLYLAFTNEKINVAQKEKNIDE